MNEIIAEKGYISLKWKYLNFIDYLLPAYIVCSLPLFYFGLHYDFLFKGVAILASLYYLFRFRVYSYRRAKTFTIFLLLVSFSFIQYIYNGRPIALYISDVSNYVAAMLFFYVGLSDDRPGRPFYNKLMYSTAIVFVLGLLCFITMPSWFLSRTIEAINANNVVEYNEFNVFEQMRFGAFWGDSYSVSHLSVFCVAIAIFSVAYWEGKKRWIAIACLIIGLVSSIASMHRASMAGSAMAVAFYIYFNCRMHRQKANWIVFASFILILVGFVFLMPSFGERVEQIFELIFNRVDDNMSLDKALKERKYTHDLMAGMRFFIFGHGLGSGGVSARAYGLPGISDMQYIKMFYENGIVGAILFISIIIHALKRGVKYISIYLTEIAIIGFILVAMLGSNSLSIYYFIVYPFWYTVGRVYNNNNEYLHKVKIKKHTNGYNSFLSSSVSPYSA